MEFEEVNTFSKRGISIMKSTEEQKSTGKPKSPFGLDAKLDAKRLPMRRKLSVS